MLQQHQIKLAAIDMVGVFPVDAFLLTLVKSDLHVRFRLDLVLILEAALKVHLVSALVLSGPGGSELVRELGFFHLDQEIEVAEHSHGGGNKRLANMRAGK